MALETLKNVKKIGGFTVKRNQDVNADSCIVIHEPNIIEFQVQDGPIKECGVNGCQINAIIETAKLIIEGLNKQFPCRENSVAITKLDEALMWLDKRTKDREARGVEGKSEV